MQFEEHIVISAPAEKIFSLYADVKNWSSWDPDVKESSINGAFTAGATGTLLPSKGPKAKINFSEVVTNRSFAVESKLPLCVMRFDHVITAAPNSNTKIVHRVSFHGFLAPFFGRVIGSQIQKGLPHTLRGLKHAVEKG